MRDVTICFLSMNRLDCMRKCLVSLYENTLYPFKVLILDNGSEKETVDFLKEIQERKNNLDVIFSKENLGVAKGRNLLFSRVNTKYIASFDNDMIFLNGWLKRIIFELEVSNLHAICPTILTKSFEVEAGYTRLCEDESRIWIHSSKEISTSKITNFMFGGASVFLSEMFKKVGNFNEGMFIGLEDIDFSLRVQNNFKEFRILFFKDVGVIHDHPPMKKKEDIEYKRLRHREDIILKSNEVFKRLWGKTALSDSDLKWLENRR